MNCTYRWPGRSTPATDARIRCGRSPGSDSSGNPLTTANGLAAFSAQANFGTSKGPVAAAIGDVNGDGRPDLVVANYGSDSVSVLLGNGTFQSQQTYATGANPQALVLGDMSVQGNVKPARSLTEPLQVAMDNGARRALIPIENKRQFLDVHPEVLEQVDPIFFGDLRQAAFKALSLT